MMQFDRMTLGKKARELGFVRDTFEKVCRLADVLDFIQKDELLSNALALKGGTAINLTIFNLPRLSVDIDMDFSENVPREDMLSRVLRLCAGTWEGDENSFSANILNGITRLVYTFGDQLNDEVFKERVGALSIKQLVRMSKERCPGSMGYAEAMLLEYNGKKKNISQRLSMNKLHMQGTAGLCSLLSDVDTSPEAATAEGVSE